MTPVEEAPLHQPLRSLVDRAKQPYRRVLQLLEAVLHGQRRTHQRQLVLAGLALEHARRGVVLPKPEQWEFSVFSQFGEDGMLAYILDHLDGPVAQRFVEFGVESYQEANTRYLVLTRNWEGLVMDGGHRHVEAIRADEVSWRHRLNAVCAFIDRDNINGLIGRAGFAGELGVLSVDIDGNDYWVAQALNCVTPAVIVVEYNALFGSTAAVSIPYKADFTRTRAHHSNLYWGCSLGAWHHLLHARGFELVGCNSAGNNAFFVRANRLGANLKPLSAAEAFQPARFREARDQHGALTFSAAPPADALSLPLVDVTTGDTITWAQALAKAQMP